MKFLDELMPDFLISSGGALVKNGTEYIYKAAFSEIETRNMIDTARIVCGEDCEITIDEVKNRADIVIGSNDADGIANFIEENILK